jgi:hypothetical protein
VVFSSVRGGGLVCGSVSGTFGGSPDAGRREGASEIWPQPSGAVFGGGENADPPLGSTRLRAPPRLLIHPIPPQAEIPVKIHAVARVNSGRGLGLSSKARGLAARITCQGFLRVGRQRRDGAFSFRSCPDAAIWDPFPLGAGFWTSWTSRLILQAEAQFPVAGSRRPQARPPSGR